LLFFYISHDTPFYRLSNYDFPRRFLKKIIIEFQSEIRVTDIRLDPS